MKKFLLLVVLTSGAGAEPPKAKTVVPPSLPVIEIRASTAPVMPERKSGTIDLPAIEGPGVEKMTVRSRYGRYGPYGPYGVPSGPGRAWPDAAPPGAPGPAGGMFAPYP